MKRTATRSMMIAAALLASGSLTLATSPLSAADCNCKNHCAQKAQPAGHQIRPVSQTGEPLPLQHDASMVTNPSCPPEALAIANSTDYAGGVPGGYGAYPGYPGYGPGGLAAHRAAHYAPNCRPQMYGQPDLFRNYYLPPTCGGATAEIYPAPYGGIPPLVGHTYYTYQPFEPHELLYPHHRTYHRYYNGGRGLTRAKVHWYNPPVRAVGDYVLDHFRIPR